jgi:hypothetical protein
MRAVLKEDLGRGPLTLASFIRDYLHGGGCLLVLAFASLGDPLPYWAHLFSQLFTATFIAAQNGWLCVERLASPHLSATVKQQEVPPPVAGLGFQTSRGASSCGKIWVVNISQRQRQRFGRNHGYKHYEIPARVAGLWYQISRGASPCGGISVAHLWLG